MEVNLNKKIRNGHVFTPNSTKEYMYDALQIVGNEELWLAYKTDEKVQRFSYGTMTGVREKNGPVLLIDGMSWNDMLGTALIDPLDDEFYTIPLFEIPSTDKVKIGSFEDVYRKGYVIFPLVTTSDFNNKPIIISKGK